MLISIYYVTLHLEMKVRMNLAASCLALAVELKRVSRPPFAFDINRFIPNRL